MGKREEIKARRERSNKIKQWLTIFAIVLIAVFIVGVLIYPSIKKQTPVQKLVIPDTIQSHKSTDMAMGDPNAPITLEVFSDFQCPVCGSYVESYEQNIIKTYVDTGKVYYVFRPFNFIGKESIRAAEGAYCAMDQGNFWGFHDMVYHNMVGENTGNLTDDLLTEFAKTVGLDTKQFSACLTSDKYLSEVQADNDYARNAGVNATPSFKIDDQIYSYNDMIAVLQNAK